MKTLFNYAIMMLIPLFMNAQTEMLNGVNVDQLLGTIEAIKGDSEIAKFKFRSHTKWISGGHCETAIQGFYGAKQEDVTRKEALVMVGDEPAILLGSNLAPNAVEAVLHGLASCLSVGIVYNASAMGIEIHSLEFDLEGCLDLEGFLGLDPGQRAGYESIVVNIQAQTSASKEDFDQLLKYVQSTSPVMDIITNSVPVQLRVDHDEVKYTGAR